MPVLSDLMAQRAALDMQIEKARREQRAAAIEQIKSLMAEHGLTPSDLTARPRKAQSKPGGRKVAPKYRDQSTGDTWSGRGLQPRWLKAALAAGRKLSDFAV
jgi:DNA-binding protein H-NS